MRLALTNFRNASIALSKENGEWTQAHLARFDGLSSYCDAQLARDDSEALACLHSAEGSLANAWRKARNLREMFSTGLAVELVHVAIDLMSYESDLQMRLPALHTALGLKEALDPLLAEMDKDLGIMLMAEMIELQAYAWMNLPDFEQRESAGLRASEMFERLRTLVHGAEDPRVIAAACELQIYGSALDLLSSQPPLEDPEKLLSLVQKTGDRIAIGSAHVGSLEAKTLSLVSTEDPTKARLLFESCESEGMRAVADFQAFDGVRRFQNSPGYVYWTMPYAFYGRMFASSQEERRQLLYKAVEDSYQVRKKGPPINICPHYSNLSFRLYYRSLIENDLKQRRRTLDEAWNAGLEFERTTDQFVPHWPQARADHFILYGRVKRELARISAANRQNALTEAVEMFRKANNHLESFVNSTVGGMWGYGDPAAKHRELARYKYELGATQLELYQETRDPELLEQALTHLRQSAEFAHTQDAPTRAGEALARVGEAYLLGNRFEQARSALSEAAQRYRDACTRYPGLEPVFESRAKLMEARAATSAARTAYQRDDYDLAATQYQLASKILEETKSWPGPKRHVRRVGTARQSRRAESY